MTTATLNKPKEKKFEFDPVEHVYTLDGKPLNGTTTVLSVIAKPALIGWASNCACDYILSNSVVYKSEKEGDIRSVPEWIIEEARTQHAKKKTDAGTKGTAVHEWAEKYINTAIEENNGYAFSPSDIEAKKFSSQQKGFILWALTNNVKFLASEQRLYSESLWVAGTADFICEVGGRLFIGDIKTSSSIYPEHFLQASAYAKFAEEMGLYSNFHGVVIVNIPKKGGLNVKENYDIEGNFKAFCGALDLFKQLKATK